MVTIYDGKRLEVWRDDEYIYLSFPGVTISVPQSEFGALLDDFGTLVYVVKCGVN